MKYIVTFSGGKDSLACVLWAKQNLPDYEIVFCDTGWEHNDTYQHIKDIEIYTGKKITILKSKIYKDFIDLCLKRTRVPSTKAKFCTSELKVKPMIDYLMSLEGDITVIQGVRADESIARRHLNEKDEFFKFYFEPYGKTKKGKPKFHTYNKKSIIKYTQIYSVDVLRPIIKWTAEMVFDYIFAAGLKANPLYYVGHSRVGCYPCIMCRQSEIKLVIDRCIERIDEIRELENKLGRTFFPPKYIPKIYCKSIIVNKKGEETWFPTIDEVVRYVKGNPDQISIDLPTIGSNCVSVYNICESN